MSGRDIVLLTRLPLEETERWRKYLQEVLPGDRIHLGPPHAELDEAVAARVTIAIAASPPPGVWRKFPSLEFIQSGWAGVDGLLADPDYPRHLPLARLVDPAMAEAMAESVAAHVLFLHRQLFRYRQQQQQRIWRALHQPPAKERRVGLLGLGEMGRASARQLCHLGFDVLGWSRRGGEVPGVRVFAGEEGLHRLLEQSEILVNILPLTAETRGIIDAKTLARLPEGATFINVARGAHVVTSDLVAALDAKHLAHAVLDVFETEPLPKDDPLWSHPDVTVLPHVAAVTDPRSAARVMGENVDRFRRGEPLEGRVELTTGY